MRDSMVTIQIEGRGVSDPRVLDAMRKVPRHRFVLPVSIAEAYSDHPLPIGFDQTISQPYIVAYMCELGRFKPGDRVLEVGAGSGYHAAIIGQIASEVFTIEIIPELADRAERTIASLGYGNIHVRQGDGYLGWPEASPFDVIMVTAAPEHIPPPLIEQLREGGRMVIPVGPSWATQQIILAEKKGGELVTRKMLPVRFVPLTGDH
ncbi:MAG: protein-L-isoaspartate(D-aspartate) O-methyltransferase [Mariprofundaceae bacterium]